MIELRVLALAAEPERFEALLAVAALTLRRPMTAAEGRVVADLLDRAGRALGKEPDRQKAALVECDRALLHALEGRIKEARASLALAWEADSSLDVIEAVAAVLAE